MHSNSVFAIEHNLGRSFVTTSLGSNGYSEKIIGGMAVIINAEIARLTSEVNKLRIENDALEMRLKDAGVQKKPERQSI